RSCILVHARAHLHQTANLPKSSGRARATTTTAAAAHHLPLHLTVALRAAVTVRAARRFTFAKMHWKPTEIFLKSDDFCSAARCARGRDRLGRTVLGRINAWSASARPMHIDPLCLGDTMFGW